MTLWIEAGMDKRTFTFLRPFTNSLVPTKFGDVRNVKEEEEEGRVCVYVRGWEEAILRGQ